MAGSLNKVTLIGNLGKDPEVRTMQDGKKVANISLATSESWKDKSTGEKKEKTEWHRITIWGPLADIAERYLKKGSKIYVSGSLQTHKWTDQAGVEKYSTEVVLQGFGAELIMLDGKPSGGVSDHDEAKGNGYQPQGSSRAAMDDEIPF